MKTKKVSVLVVQAFLGECKKVFFFNKKNKVFDDCRLENLEIKSISNSTKESYNKGNNLRNKPHLLKNQKSCFIWTRHTDGKEFNSSELIIEYKKQVRGNIVKGIKVNRLAYGSLWSRRPI